MRVLVVADTHLGRGHAGRLMERLDGLVQRADAILHAGDIADSSVLAELGRFAPVHAVRGNNDVSPALVRSLPERTVVALDGCTVALLHDSGASTGRARRLRRWFPTADAVVFGHSHIAWHETDVGDDGHVQHHLNPGSALLARGQPTCTVAWLEIDDGSVQAVRHVAVPQV